MNASLSNYAEALHFSLKLYKQFLKADVKSLSSLCKVLDNARRDGNGLQVCVNGDSPLRRSEMFIARNAKASSTPFEGAEVNQRCSLQDALRSFERRRRVSAFDAIDISPLNGVKSEAI